MSITTAFAELVRIWNCNSLSLPACPKTGLHTLNETRGRTASICADLFVGHAQGLSIACSTPEAVCWDPSWANTHEISGRAMKNVHDSAEGFQYERRQDMKEKRSADDFVGESH
jgi:hypothetical protein